MHDRAPDVPLQDQSQPLERLAGATGFIENGI
jgi:hypothetical protein